MSNDEKIYGVIIEWKTEGPLIMEGYPTTLDKAMERMRSTVARPDVIRGAVFKAVHADGNEALIPKEKY